MGYDLGADPDTTLPLKKFIDVLLHSNYQKSQIYYFLFYVTVTI